MIPIIRMTKVFPALRPAIDDQGYNMKQGNLEFLNGLYHFFLSFLRHELRPRIDIENIPGELLAGWRQASIGAPFFLFTWYFSHD